jgi:hypothetical protein
MTCDNLSAHAKRQTKQDKCKMVAPQANVFAEGGAKGWVYYAAEVGFVRKSACSSIFSILKLKNAVVRNLLSKISFKTLKKT